ncbi:MAG: XdhC family protein, partial [Coriobacteriales bacterium]|nr:XdhC family protein [Coriobacteriales bacterium]
MDKPTQQELAAALEQVIAALEAGQAPQPNAALRRAFYCFSAEALAHDPDIVPEDLEKILAQLSAADLPTFQAALAAVQNGRQAWLGFKVVTDPALVLDSVDTSVWNFNGPGQGSSDDQSGVFFSTKNKEIVFSREPSPRDRRQMLDITRGPHMHNSQYAGVAWTSIPLEPQGRVVMLGAGDVSRALEKVVALCDFDTVVIDDDADYLNEARFATSRRVLLENWENLSTVASLDALAINEHDYLCVLTRGHAHDTEAMLWAVGTPASYIGMLGNPMKNEQIFAFAAQTGVAPEVFTAERIHAPIGLRMGG